MPTKFGNALLIEMHVANSAHLVAPRNVGMVLGEESEKDRCIVRDGRRHGFDEARRRRTTPRDKTLAGSFHITYQA